MALKYSGSLRDAQLDRIIAVAGNAAKLRIYSGSAPTACSDAPTGTLLVEMSLPSTWMAAASGGSVAKSGTWSDVGKTGVNDNAGYFRIYDSGGSTCHLQGTCGQGSGDLSLDNIAIADGQTVTVSTFTVSAGNG